jgi:hypothetical protein
LTLTYKEPFALDEMNLTTCAVHMTSMNDHDITSIQQDNVPEISSAISLISSPLMPKNETISHMTSLDTKDGRTMKEFASGRFSGGIPSKSSMEKQQQRTKPFSIQCGNEIPVSHPDISLLSPFRPISSNIADIATKHDT